MRKFGYLGKRLVSGALVAVMLFGDTAGCISPLAPVSVYAEGIENSESEKAESEELKPEEDLPEEGKTEADKLLNADLANGIPEIDNPENGTPDNSDLEEEPDNVDVSNYKGFLGGLLGGMKPLLASGDDNAFRVGNDSIGYFTDSHTFTYKTPLEYKIGEEKRTDLVTIYEKDGNTSEWHNDEHYKPGEYNLTVVDPGSSEKYSYLISISKDTLGAATNLEWKKDESNKETDTVFFALPNNTAAGYLPDDGAVKHYLITLYKNGVALNGTGATAEISPQDTTHISTIDNVNYISYDFASAVSANGYGKYTYTVQTIVSTEASDRYNNSVVTYETDKSKEHLPKDNNSPVIEDNSFKLIETIEGYSLNASANDKESGIYGYVFSKDSTFPLEGDSGHAWSNPTGDGNVDAPKAEGEYHDYTKVLSEAGVYYFHVKDKDNVVTASNSIPVSKITYNNYYNGAASTKSDKVIFADTTSEYTLITPKRNGYVFKGWFSSDNSEDVADSIASITAGSAKDYQFYAKWERNGVSIDSITADSENILSAEGHQYDKTGSLTATVVKKDSSLDLSYQWYKESSEGSNTYEPISGATSETISVKNVSDSGKYKVRVIFDEGEDGFIESTAVDAKITPARLSLTPKYTEIVDGVEKAKSIHYGDSAPSSDDYSYEITGWVEGENEETEGLTKGTVTAYAEGTEAEYKRGDNAGSYNLKGNNFKADNYEFDYVNGTLSVLPKPVSDDDNNGVSLSFSQEAGHETDTYTYTGSEIEPSVTLIDSYFDQEAESDKYTIPSTNYSVKYSNQVAAGTATATVTFTGNYDGTLTKNYTIGKSSYISEISFDSGIFASEDGKSFMYDGEAHKTAYKVSNNPEKGAVVFYFASVAGSDADGNVSVGEYTTTFPKNAGKYKVYAVISETANYGSAQTPAADFEITKRPITIASDSEEWVYDGHVHTVKDIDDKKVTGLDPLFASGEGFQYKYAIGEISEKGTVTNTIKYDFAHGTDAANYEVTLKPGTLKITEQKLTTPANQDWDMSMPGKATWIAVVKDHVAITYELQLYRVSDGNYSPVDLNGDEDGTGSIRTTDTYYDFNSIIHDDLLEKDVPADGYVYTLKSIPTGGEKVGNYSESDATNLSDSLKKLYATKIKIGDYTGNASVKDAYFRDKDGEITKDPQYALQGERVIAYAESNSGYTTRPFGFVDDSGILLYGFVNHGYEYGVSTTAKPLANIVLTPGGYDNAPIVDEFKADKERTENSGSNKQEVVLEFRGHDTIGLSSFRIAKGEIHTGDSGIIIKEGTNISESYDGIDITYSYQKNGNDIWTLTGTAVVRDSGDYNFAIWDTDHSFSYHHKIITVKEEIDGKPVVEERMVFDPVSVYKITFNPGTAGDDAAVNNGYPTYTLKLKDQSITLQDIKKPGTNSNKDLLYADGFSFTNFKGNSTGLYPNNGIYTANKDDTLTALWSNEIYAYTVHYFYQGIDDSTGMGETDSEKNIKYTEDISATASFTAGYHELIGPSLDKIQKNKVGFIRDTSKDEEDKFYIESNDGVVNVYYKRAPYTITYKYTDIDGTEKIAEIESYNYGEKVVARTEKPSAAGYTFIGWTYGDSGKTPATMPENSLVATGHFEADATSYVVDYYYENIAGDGYILDHSEIRYTYPTAKDENGNEKDYVSATHNSVIDVSNMAVPEIEGFTYSVTDAKNSALDGTPPESSVTTATVLATEGNQLHIAHYYTRDAYSITLNVYKGGRTETAIYTKTFSDIKYGTPFTGDGYKTASYYEEYDKEHWIEKISEDDMKGYELSSIADWSTGETPVTMPAGNIVVNRDYISTEQCPYDIQIYYEEELRKYTHLTTLTQYENEGKDVKIGVAAEAGITITQEQLQKIYTTLTSYEIDTVKLEDPEEQSLGTVINPKTNNGDRLVLKVYFKRPICHTKITYKYYDPNLNQIIVLGTLEKTGEWYDKYDPEVGLFFGTGGADTDIAKKTNVSTEALWKFTPAKISKTPDDKGVYTSGVNLEGTQYVDVTFDQYGNVLTDGSGNKPQSIDFSTAHIVTSSYHSGYLDMNGNGAYHTEIVELSDVETPRKVVTFGAETTNFKNYCDVTYVHNPPGEGGGPAHYYINIKYRTNDLKRYKTDIGVDVEAPITVEIGGKVYKVRVANACDLYQEATANLTGKEAYKDKALNAGLTKTTYTNGRSSKTTEIFLAAQGSGFKIGSLAADDDNYLYIADYDNSLIWGNPFHKGYWDKYRDILDDDAVNTLNAYKSKEESLKNQGAAPENYDTVYPDAYIYSYTNSYVPVVTGPFDQVIYYRYGEPTYLIYNVYGNTYSCHYSKNTQTHIDHDISQPGFISHFASTAQEGSEIVWYTDTSYTSPAVDFEIKSTTTIYGRYEKITRDGWQNVYYELANPIEINGETKHYLTKEQLDTFISSHAEGYSMTSAPDEIVYDTEFRDNENKPITKKYNSTVYTYLYNNEPVLIARTIPELSSSEIMPLNYNADIYKYHGFEYDGTKENKVKAYCQNEAIDLQAYYRRITYPITFDFNDKDVNGNKRTDDVTIDAAYHAVLEGERGIAPVAKRPGYTFDHWKYYKATTDGTGKTVKGEELESAPEKMPEYGLIAEAQWTAAKFDYDVFHYFQKNDQTYATELVKSIETAYKGSTGTTKNFEFNDKSDGSINVLNIDGRNYGILTLSSSEYAFLTGTLDGDTFKSTYSDLIGIKASVNKEDDKAMTSEENYGCNKYAYSKDETFDGKLDISMYGYDFTVHRIGGNINTLHESDEANEYKADIEMSMALYYRRTAGSVIKVYTRTLDDGYATTEVKDDSKSTGLTVTGEGNYNYGIGATLSVEVAAGYDFVGWYTDAEYDEKFENAEFETTANTYADNGSKRSINVPTVGKLSLVAVSKPKVVKEPASYIENLTPTYVYGYADSSNNILSMKVDLEHDSAGNDISDSSVYHVKSYQWYRCDASGKKTEDIAGATAATFNIPSGLDAGMYYFGCTIEVERYDNGRSTEITAYTAGNISGEGEEGIKNAPVTVVKSPIVVTEGSYRGIYDGKSHDATLAINSASAPDHRLVYFALEELTSENYKKVGTLYTGNNYEIRPSDIGSPDTKNIGYTFVATEEKAGKTVVKLDENNEPAPQFIYYYIADNSEANGKTANYEDKSGRLSVTIIPKTVTVKPLAAAFKKTYDGTRELTAEDKERFRKPGEYFKIEGLLPEDENKLTAHFDGVYNDAHVNNANSILVTVDGIETVTDPQANLNYVVASTSVEVSFSGQIVPRLIGINWLKAEGDASPIIIDGTEKYYQYDYDGSEKAPFPQIHVSKEADRGVLVRDMGCVTVEATGMQKNCGSYTAQGKIVVKDSPLESQSSDYKVDDGELKCAYKIVSNNVELKLVSESVPYDKSEHGLTKLTKDTLITLGVILDDSDEPEYNINAETGVITVSLSGESKNNTVSYSVNKKYINAGEYTDIQVVQGDVKVMSSENKNITGNFGFTYPNSTLTIDKKVVKVSGITASNKDYDGTADATLDVSNVSFEGLIDGDSLELEVSQITGKFRNDGNTENDANAGTGKTVAITISDTALTGHSKDNYSLDIENSQKSTNADIMKAVLAVSPTGFESIDYTYGDSLPVVFTNSLGTESTSGSESAYLLVTGFVNEEGRDVITGNVTFIGHKDEDNKVRAGEKTISLRTTEGEVAYIDGLSAENYYIVLGNTSKFTVKKRPLTVSSSANKTKVYDGTINTVGTTAVVNVSDFSLGNVIDPDEVRIAEGFAAAYDSKNAGDSGKHTGKATKITATGLELAGTDAGNYTLGDNNTCDITATITKASLIITANDLLDVAGTKVVYGYNPLTADSGVMCSVKYEGFVTVDGINEDESELDGTLIYTSAAKDDRLAFNPEEESNRRVTAEGEYYDITPEGVTADNYEITFVSGKFNVVKKVIKVKANDSNVAYKMYTEDSLKKGYTVSVISDSSSGWEYLSDSEKAINNATVTDAAKAICYSEPQSKLDMPANESGYPITIGKPETDQASKLKATLEGSYPNYDFQFIPGILTIGRRELIIDTSALELDSKIYDTTTKVLDKQIKLAAGKEIADLFKTYDGLDNQCKLDDITNIETAYTTWKSNNPSGLLTDFLKTQGLEITGIYDDKDVKLDGGNISDKPVKLTYKLATTADSYLGLRYNFKDETNEVFIKDDETKTAKITKKALEIKAVDCDVEYGSELPSTFTTDMLIVNPSDNDNDFAGEGENKESFDVLGGDLVLNTNYKSSNAATLVGATNVTRTPAGYTSDNYEITFTPGKVTVKQAKLEEPQNVRWSSTNVGTITWDKVDGIGDVNVGGYVIQLFRKAPGESGAAVVEVVNGDAEHRITVISNENSYDFYDVIKNFDTVAIYTVKIYAIPADENNDAAEGAIEDEPPITHNVAESDIVDTSTVIPAQGGTGKLAMANVTPVFASDSDTANGKYKVEIAPISKDGTVGEYVETKFNEDGSVFSGGVVILAGEAAKIRVTPLEEKWTGYTIEDSNFKDPGNINPSEWGMTSTSDGEGQNCTNEGKGVYTGTFNLNYDASSTEITPTVSLTPRPATLAPTIIITDAAEQEHLKVGYGFPTEKAPTAEVTVDKEDSDNIGVDGYSYKYDWVLKSYNLIETKPETDFADTASVKLPVKIKGAGDTLVFTPAGVNRYTFECTITATRNDNGQTKKIKVTSEAITVVKTSASSDTYMPGWTYGDTRKTPVYGDATFVHPDGELPIPEYSTDGGKTWTTTPPKNAGTYKARVRFKESSNVEEIKATAAEYTISKAKLEKPTAYEENPSEGALSYGWEATASAPYGMATWKASPQIAENAGDNPDYIVKPEYEVILYKDGTAVDTQSKVTSTSYDFLSKINELGEGSYYYTVEAIPNEQKGKDNCDNSDVMQSNTIVVKKLQSSSGSFEKTYDGTYESPYSSGVTTQGITVLAKEDENSYEWYVNGENVTTDSEYKDYYVPVFYYKDSPDNYSCISTASNGAKTYYLNEKVIINRRPVTFVADSAEKVYDGTALTKTSFTVEEGTSLADSDFVIEDEGTDSETINGSIAGSQTNVGTSANEPSGFVINRSISGTTTNMNANYSISYKNGTLTVTPRSLEETHLVGENVVSDFLIDDVYIANSVVYDGTEHKPTPTLKDTKLATGFEYELVAGEDKDFVYSYSTDTTNVGTVTITMTGKGNYKDTITKTFEITKRPVTFTGETKTDAVYTGVEQKIEGITYSEATYDADSNVTNSEGLLSGHTSNLTYEAKGTEASDTSYPGAFYTGTGTAQETNAAIEAENSNIQINDTAGADVTRNYEITLVEGALKINKTSGTFTISLADDSYVYDATAHSNNNTPESTAVSGITSYKYSLTNDFTEGSGWTTDLSTLTKTDVGEYLIYVQATNPNYSDVAECTSKLIIDKRPVTFTGETKTDAVYSGLEQSIDGITYSQATYDETTNMVTNSEGLLIGHEYNLTYEAKGTEASGTPYPGKFYTEGSTTEETQAIVGTESSNLKIYEGEKDVTANYNITLAAGTLTINKSSADWSITLAEKLYDYDATAHSNDNTPESTAASGTTSYKYSFTNDFTEGSYKTNLNDLTKTDVGEYPIYVQATNPNYTATATCTSKLTINKITPTVAVECGASFIDISGEKVIDYIDWTADTGDKTGLFTIVYSADSTPEGATGKGTRQVKWYRRDKETGVKTPLDEAPSDAGYYTIEVSYTSGDNFNASNADSTDFKINRRYAITYDANSSAITEVSPAIVIGNIPVKNENGCTDSEFEKAFEIPSTLCSLIPTAKQGTVDRYVFKEWNTKPDGTGTSYAAGASYTDDKDITLYAVWEEIVEGNISIDYTYVDPVDEISKVSNQRIHYVMVDLIQVVDGVEKVVETTRVDFTGADTMNVTSAPYKFSKTYPTYVDGKKAEYKVSLEPSLEVDLNNYGRHHNGYKGRDINAKYTPHEFIIPWEITIDDSLKGYMDGALIPNSVEVKVLYRETDDDSWHVITQHDMDEQGNPLNGVSCENQSDAFEGHYYVWKWNSSKKASYQHNLAIASITMSDGTVKTLDELPEIEFISYIDEGEIPVYFKPDDPVEGPNDVGEVCGGKDNAGVMTGYLRLKRYSVKYNANGGSSVPAEQTKIHGDNNFKLQTVKPGRSGYTFEGWSTSPTGTVQYKPGDVYKGNEDLILYAVWKIIPPPENNPGPSSGGGSGSSPVVPVITPTPSTPIPVIRQDSPSPTKPKPGSGSKNGSSKTGDEADSNALPGDTNKEPTANDKPIEVDNPYADGGNNDKGNSERLEVTENIKDRKDEKIELIKNGLSENEKLGKLFDVNKYITEDGSERILDGTEELHRVSVPIPDELLIMPAGVERNFKIVRIYEDENGNLVKEIIDSSVDGTDIIFDADTKSSYAIIYDDEVPLAEYEDIVKCYWHWLILLTALIYLIVLLLTMKQKDDEYDEEAEEKKRKKKNMAADAGQSGEDDDEDDPLVKKMKWSKRRRLLATLVYAIILYIITIKGFCNLEIPFDIVTGIIVGGAEYGTYRHKYKEVRERQKIEKEREKERKKLEKQKSKG